MFQTFKKTLSNMVEGIIIAFESLLHILSDENPIDGGYSEPAKVPDKREIEKAACKYAGVKLEALQKQVSVEFKEAWKPYRQGETIHISYDPDLPKCQMSGFFQLPSGMVLFKSEYFESNKSEIVIFRHAEDYRSGGYLSSSNKFLEFYREYKENADKKRLAGA